MNYLNSLLLLTIISLCPVADTASAELTGEQIFSRECGICHSANGFGTMMLARRLGKDRSLLRDRTDLISVYVKTVVRRGLASMPPLSRVEVSDIELDAVISYLTHPEEHHSGE